MRKTFAFLVASLTLTLPSLVHSGSDHAAMDHAAQMEVQTPTETGQSGFAAIAEIVNLLRADTKTDWSNVNIDALRTHLVDMDAVTLHAFVVTNEADGGAIYDVTSTDPEVLGSIRRMVPAHGQTMSGVDGMDMATEEILNGARMIVTGPEVIQIRALGFFGIMALGMHHQAHHMALARGSNPHHN